MTCPRHVQAEELRQRAEALRRQADALNPHSAAHAHSAAAAAASPPPATDPFGLGAPAAAPSAAPCSNGTGAAAPTRFAADLEELFGRIPLEPTALLRLRATFADNDIDGVDALRLLTDADYKELGLSLGVRRKLIAALDPSSAAAGALLPPAAAALPVVTPTPPIAGALPPSSSEGSLHGSRDGFSVPLLSELHSSLSLGASPDA